MVRTCLFKFGASERRLEQFCGVVKPREQNAELPFNASEQEKPCIAQAFQKIVFSVVRFLCGFVFVTYIYPPVDCKKLAGKKKILEVLLNCNENNRSV